METKKTQMPSIEELAAAYRKAMNNGDPALAGVIESAVLQAAIGEAGSHEAAMLATFAIKACD